MVVVVTRPIMLSCKWNERPREQSQESCFSLLLISVRLHGRKTALSMRMTVTTTERYLLRVPRLYQDALSYQNAHIGSRVLLCALPASLAVVSRPASNSTRYRNKYFT